MTNTYRGEMMWWFDATLLEYHCANVTGRASINASRIRSTGFRLAR